MLTTSTDVRRRVPYGRQAGATSLKVELVTDNPMGEWCEGLVRVPDRLCNALPDTNEKHEFDRVVTAQLHQWEAYRKARGWQMVTTPKVRGPFDPPTPTTDGDPKEDGVKWYFAIARFRRTERLWRPLEEVLYMGDMARVYGEKPDADPLPWNKDGNDDTGWINPLEHAEQRRKALGLKRADYLFGPLDEPL